MKLARRLLPGDGDFILLVDDDSTSLAILERALSDRFIVRSAKDAAEAIDILDTRTPALVILDVMMPDVSGIDLCRMMKSTERLKDVPVIFLSASAKPADFGDGYAAGGVMYVAKPVRPTQILQIARLYASRIEKKETI